MQKVVKRSFNTISDLVKYCNAETTKNNVSVFGAGTLTSMEQNSGSWTGTKTWSEAETLLTKGWDSGSKKLVESLNIANAKAMPKEVKRAVYDIVGFQPCVPRYLQGLPTNMINKKTVKQTQKVITLVKSISYAAKHSADDILKDSVKFLQLVQAIEKQGIRVNAYTIWNVKISEERFIVKVKIKSATERLNISKISFPLMHPSFLRRFMFRLLETEHDLKSSSWKRGYGMPDQNCQEYLEKGEYYVPIMMKDNEIKDLVSSIK